ncbi:MAG: alginate export family protein [Elusimicrobiota bacterium]|nr:alginate export family protein [Elusimicrobiota bacterium]
MKKVASSVFFVFFFALCASSLTAAAKTEKSEKNRTIAASEPAKVKSVKEEKEADSSVDRKIKVDGSLEVDAMSLDNETDFINTASTGTLDDLNSRILTRAIVGFSVNFDDKTSGRIVIGKNNRTWGGTAAGENINALNASICVDNAYIVIDNVLDTVKLTIGRQFAGEKGDLIMYFGPTDDNSFSINALDAFKAESDITDYAKAEFLFGKVAEAGAFAGERDTNLYGLKLWSEKAVTDATLAGYWYNSTIQHPNPDAAVSVSALGAKINGKIAGTDFGYKAEAALNFGNVGSTSPIVNFNGNAIIIGANMEKKLDSGMTAKAKLEYARGSGDSSATDNKVSDFQDINSDLRYGLIFGRTVNFAGVGINGAGLTNLSVINLGGGLENLTDRKLALILDYLIFSITDNGGSNISTAIGSELDLKLKYPVHRNVKLGVSYAVFSAGKAIKDITGNDDSVTRLGADLGLKF